MPEGRGVKYWEPMAEVTILTPQDYVGPLLQILQSRRGEQTELSQIDSSRMLLRYLMPWQEVAADLYDEVKSTSSGYASFDYDHAPARPADIVRVDMLLNGESIDALSFVCHKSVAEQRGRKVAVILVAQAMPELAALDFRECLKKGVSLIPDQCRGTIAFLRVWCLVRFSIFLNNFVF
eukprot:SAG31_NODE_662_length_13028_cov_3.364529_4_plen_179_part_00